MRSGLDALPPAHGTRLRGACPEVGVSCGGACPGVGVSCGGRALRVLHALLPWYRRPVRVRASAARTWVGVPEREPRSGRCSDGADAASLRDAGAQPCARPTQRQEQALAEQRDKLTVLREAQIESVPLTYSSIRFHIGA